MADSEADFRLEVDGDVFEVRADPSRPGAYHHSWVSGPNAGYGFTSRRSDHGTNSLAEHEICARDFLAHPKTGYIEDEDDDEE